MIGTGPTIRYSAMPEMFESLMYTARRELVISTPYYVPDESMQAGAVRQRPPRGRDDHHFPGAKRFLDRRCGQSQLLRRSARRRACASSNTQGGLLHTKSLTLDGEITLIGSANMDRRSFELNYENNILFYDRSLTAEMRQRQDSYIAKSKPVTAEMVAHWTWRRRLWNNAIAMLGPVL